MLECKESGQIPNTIVASTTFIATSSTIDKIMQFKCVISVIVLHIKKISRSSYKRLTYFQLPSTVTRQIECNRCYGLYHLHRYICKNCKHKSPTKLKDMSSTSISFVLRSWPSIWYGITLRTRLEVCSAATKRN